ncbi:MAG: ATP-binding cassette domain-containing protein [Proteobacteria bacterium]|nr:ATP-binding cassette domain-containing protein [Pseudomonadota bacterium]MBU1717268.1 ATP-binding cassette domain-containing protein [Pseudomonadota bacterium]
MSESNDDILKYGDSPWLEISPCLLSAAGSIINRLISEETILMTDTSPIAPVNDFVGKLDRQAVLNAVSALAAPDPVAMAPLKKGLNRLTASTNWSAEIVRLERLGLSARHFFGPLREALELASDLVLLRNNDDGFALLHYMEKRWQYLGADGLPLPVEVVVDDGDKIEAVVMNIPIGSDKFGGFASLSALWPELRAAWAEVGLASLFINSGQLLLPIFALLIYDKIALNGLFETLWALVFGMGLYLVTDAGMRLVRSWVTERISVDLTLRGDEKLWSKLVAQVDLPAGGFPRFLSNYRDLTQSRDFVSSTYLLSIADIPFLFLYLTVIGLIAWQLVIVIMLLILLFSGAGFLLQSRLNNLAKEAERNNTLKLAFMGETLGCLDVVRTTPGAGTFLRHWRHLVAQSTGFDAKKRLASYQMGMLSLIMQTLATVVILSTGVYLIHAQLLSIGKLIACNLLAGRAMAQVASLFAVTGKWQDFKRAAARMGDSLAEIEERECTPRPDIVANISVVGLGKHYEGRPAALEAISFTIKPGERIALLGRPGAGKSTLLRCLGGLSQPDTGQILIDGLALDDISRFDRVKWLAYKAQDPAVFAGTLEDNLRISGCTEQKRFSEAIWVSGLENEFQSGRMSLGMSLEERGNNLSGGQRQKVALARVFAQASRILLLDEPTLGLDPESERQLAERLPKLLDNSAVLIMTTHSPVMLEMVQRIIALDGGRLVADGPREKLVTLPARKVANQ